MYKSNIYMSDHNNSKNSVPYFVPNGALARNVVRE